MINQYKKQDDSELCLGLNLSEFKCKCDYHACRTTLVNYKLILCYEKFRKLINRSLKINSGYRCPAWNFQVGGSALSQHQTGTAIDISLETIGYLSQPEIEFALIESGFTFIKFYDSFVHCDCRGM